MNTASYVRLATIALSSFIAACSSNTGEGRNLGEAEVITFSIDDVRIPEGHSGSTFATFTVTASPVPRFDGTVDFATESGTATAGSDFTPVRGSLRFERGTATRTISIEIIGDTVLESDEAFFVRLTDPQFKDRLTFQDAKLADSEGVGTIVNDDEPLLSAEPSNLTIALNGGGTLTLRLAEPAPKPTDFSIAVTGIPLDAPKTIGIPAGQSEGYVSVLASEELGNGNLIIQSSSHGALNVPVSVVERAFSIDVFPQQFLYPGDTFTITISLGSPAPDADTRFDVSASDNRIANFDEGSFVVPAGQLEKRVAGRALAPGTTRISVAQAGHQVHPLSFVVGVRTGVRASDTLTSFELVELAETAGELSEEDATLYKVMASLDLPALPAQFVGIPDGAPYKHGLQWLVRLYPRLLSSTRERINQYLMPPAYIGAWSLDSQGGTKERQQILTTPLRDRGALGMLGRNSKTACGDLAATTRSDGWTILATPHFNVHYYGRDLTVDDFETLERRQLNSILGVTSQEYYDWLIDKIGTAEVRRQNAKTVAAAAEDVFQSLTMLMGRTPLADLEYPCNGGNGAIDIYMQLAVGVYADTVPYELGECSQVPAFIRFGAWQRFGVEQRNALLRGVLAHEFMHVLQFSFGKAAACESYDWMDEATAQWAMDHVYPKSISNMEHGAARLLWSDYDSFNGVGSRLSEFRVPIDKTTPRGSGVCKAGYCDYPFFLYVARRYEPAVVREIYEAAGGFDAIDAIDQGLSSNGGLAAVYTGYASASWNDWGAKHADDFYRWDSLTHGVVDGYFRSGGKADSETIPARLNGQPERVISEEIIERLTVLKPQYRSNQNGFTRVYRFSVQPLRFVFDDAGVSSVLFDNRPAALARTTGPNSNLRAIAHYKVGGQWRGPEDWTNRSYITFCRDVKDERVEELVLLYTNVFIGLDLEGTELDPNGIAAGVTFTPRLRISNTGCWRWSGTASSEQTTPYGGFIRDSASVTLEREVNESTGVLKTRFTPLVGGKATTWAGGQMSALPCTITIEPTEGPILPTDGWLDLHANWGPDWTDTDETVRNGDPWNRLFTEGVGTTQVTVTSILSCPDAPPLIRTGPEPVPWMTFSDQAVSPDGRHLQFKIETVLPDGSVDTVTANLTALRED